MTIQGGVIKKIGRQIMELEERYFPPPIFYLMV